MEASLNLVEGGLLVDKPKDWTSHDVVHKLRRFFQLQKIGHCGTLDPNATGLLLIVVGRATKLSERLMGQHKIYSGVLKLGEATSTYDGDGDLVRSLPVPPYTLEDLEPVAASFVGDSMQIPPMVSAIKKDGVPLYKLARKGIEVEREPRLIHLFHFKLLSYEEPLLSFKVACTKGTYVRSLVHDFGEKLGCGAHLKDLRRLNIGHFSIEKAHTLDALLTMSPKSFRECLIPIPELIQPPGLQ